MKTIQYQCTKVQKMENESHIKEWIRAVAYHLRMSPSSLALNAGLAASTVTRYLNDTTGTLTVRQDTLGKISNYSGIPVLQMPTERDKLLISHKHELKLYSEQDLDLPDWFHAAIAAIIKGQEQVVVFILHSNVLNLAGFFPGDAVLVKRTKRPRAGDIVCARIYLGQSDFVLRLYEPPYLLTHSSSEKPERPLTVDENTVSIDGVVIGSVRFIERHLAFIQDNH